MQTWPLNRYKIGWEEEGARKNEEENKRQITASREDSKEEKSLKIITQMIEY